MMELATRLATVWPLIGLALSFVIVPWGDRTYYAGRGHGLVARILGVAAVFVLYSAFWPLYLWIWWRTPPKDDIERLIEAAERADIASELRRLADSSRDAE